MWRMIYSILVNIARLPGYDAHMHRMMDQPENYSGQDKYDYVRFLVERMKKSGHIKTECSGAENLPTQGGYILYPNHQGKFDAYSIVGVHEKELSVVMDREKSYDVFVNEIIDVLGGKRMALDDTRQSLKIINQVAREVEEGRRYIIFPEGAYDGKKHNGLWDFKPGCFKAAMKARAPIVPVAIVDTYKVYNSWTPFPVKTQVHYLKPLYYEEYSHLPSREISDIVKARIEEKLRELGCI